MGNFDIENLKLIEDYIMQNHATLYETDFYAWTQEQENLLKQRNWNNLDLIHLQEELHLMGASEKRELSNRLSVLLMHLLKWKYQPTHRVVSWELTIKGQRLEVKDVLDDNPSLSARLDDYLISAYAKAILKAANETKLSYKAFPQLCEWSIAQIFDDSFFPN